MVVWCDNIGLLSLILLGCELRVICHHDLVSLDFYGIPITQYGSTVYIGMALVWPALIVYLRKS